MGNREKFVYRQGELIRLADSATVYKAQSLNREVITPDEYRVELHDDGRAVSIYENEQGVFISRNGTIRRLPGTSSPLRLPRFEDKTYGRVLRVLHHELLFNIRDGAPYPCLLTYDAPFYRDAAMTAMCLRHTGNTALLLPWLRRVNRLYDMQAGVAETDNLGELLYMLNLFLGERPRFKRALLAEARRRLVSEDGAWHLTGTTDGGPQPQYQTDWLVTALSLDGSPRLTSPDGTEIPLSRGLNRGDDYSEMSHFLRSADKAPLNYWRTKTRLRTRLHDAKNALLDILRPWPQRGDDFFPYLYWARSTYFSKPQYSMLTASYPLSWEQNGARSHPERMSLLDPSAPARRMSYPHSWTAAEMFLHLYAFNAVRPRFGLPFLP